MNLLLDSTIKVSLVMLFALAAAAMWRRRPAAVRHWVLSVAIVAAALTPLLVVVAPAWSIRPRMVVSDRLIASTSPSLTAPGEARRSASTTPLSPSTLAPAITAARLIEWAWLAGFAMSVAVLGLGLGRMAWLAADSTEVVDGPWMEAAERLASAYKLRRVPRLLISRHSALLVTWGVVAPSVMLPRSAPAWPAQRIHVVLAHEFAHIQRRDWVTHMIAELLRAAYWFNPLVWIACRQLRQESEYACDDAVLNRGVAGSDYATHLVELARSFRQSRPLWLPAPAIAGPSQLERRIRTMLNTRVDRAPVGRSSRAAIAVILIGLTVAIAGAQTLLATVSGSIMDPVGHAIPGATVTMTNTQTQARHDLRADGAGRFTLGGLPAGDYLLEARIPGFATSQGTITLTAGQTLQRDIALQVGTISETITVSGRAGDPDAADRPRTATAEFTAPACNASPAGGDIRPPLKLRDVRPLYPQDLRNAGIQGTVVLTGRISTDGLVNDLQVVAPVDAGLASAAMDAVSQWRFSPTLLDCVPIEVGITTRITFVRE